MSMEEVAYYYQYNCQIPLHLHAVSKALNVNKYIALISKKIKQENKHTYPCYQNCREEYVCM